jgi:hypothetical protein
MNIEIPAVKAKSIVKKIVQDKESMITYVKKR